MDINILNLDNVDEIMNKYKVSRLCAKVISAMKLNEEDLKEIIYSTKSLFDIEYNLFSDITKRIKIAKEKNEKVLICGDYDCDGICATTILYDALQQLNIQCGYYIPNRFSEGYGLHIHTVEMAKEKGYNLLITVDNGVKASEALMKAKELGIDVILTDHHNYIDEELVYDFFLHPQILPEFYKGMCGAGISFMIASSLIGIQNNHVILAGIATLADVVVLRGLNRILVKECIRLLNMNFYTCIQQLANDTNTWDEKKIAYQIVPKLNCVGRMADRANVNNVVKLLLCKDVKQMAHIIEQINRLNEIRKQLTLSMEHKAESMVNEENTFQVLYDSSFHEGLNGIVAGHFMNKLKQPVMVLSENEGILKGSIRSIGIDLTDCFNPIQEHLLSYGGHKDAAGISFKIEELDYIKKFVNELKIEKENLCTSVISVTQDEITIPEILSLNILKPFGNGFQAPLFMIKDNVNVSKIGNGNHLKYIGENISYLYFNEGKRYTEDSYKSNFTFIGNFEVNRFRYKTSIHMIVEDIID